MMYGEKVFLRRSRKELKEITVWIVCDTTMNVAENSTCEKDY